MSAGATPIELERSVGVRERTARSAPAYADKPKVVTYTVAELGLRATRLVPLPRAVHVELRARANNAGPSMQVAR